MSFRKSSSHFSCILSVKSKSSVKFYKNYSTAVETASIKSFCRSAEHHIFKDTKNDQFTERTLKNLNTAAESYQIL